MQPQPSELVRAPFLSAPAEVKKFEPRSGYYMLEVVLEDGQHMFGPLRITVERLAQQGRIRAGDSLMLVFSPCYNHKRDPRTAFSRERLHPEHR